MQTEQLLCWRGTTDTEHNTISGSSEDEEEAIQTFVRLNFL